MMLKKLCVGFLLATQFSLGALAGTFDCSVIYDEFISLMNKNFIINPAAYTKVQAGRLSRNDYNNLQKGKFMALPENKNWGVAMFRTNKNTYGKLLFTWGEPVNSGYPSLILKSVTKYGRVLDAYLPQVTERVNIATSWQIDLDTMQQSGDAQTDLWYHNVNGTEMYIEAVNGANLYFPMESLCK